MIFGCFPYLNLLMHNFPTPRILFISIYLSSSLCLNPKRTSVTVSLIVSLYVWNRCCLYKVAIHRSRYYYIPYHMQCSKMCCKTLYNPSKCRWRFPHNNIWKYTDWNKLIYNRFSMSKVIIYIISTWYWVMCLP